MEKYQYFNGLKFTRDDKTGYYLNSTIRKRMHRYVWEYYNGEIPSGYHIHHKDKDKSNNDINNLELLSAIDHCTMHGIEADRERHDWMVNNLAEKARPKASEWHRSEEGRSWHREQYEQVKDKLHKRETKACEYCGKEYEGIGHNRFCSNKCKSAWRRKEGLDNVERTCICCGKTFITNKYYKTKTCSRSCAVKMWHRSKSKAS